jgi:hypothetical protein
MLISCDKNSAQVFDDQDHRQTIPIDLAPKSSESYGELSTDFDADDSEIEVADDECELIENSDDRPTLDISEPFAA